MQNITNKLQDMQPLFLDSNKDQFIQKVEKNKYAIYCNYFSYELRTINFKELQWYLRVNKDDCALVDLNSSLTGTTSKNITVQELSKFNSYDDYLEYKIICELEEAEYNKSIPSPEKTIKKTTMGKNVMQVLLLLKKELTNIQETTYSLFNFLAASINSSFIFIVALILSLFFSSQETIVSNKDNKTSVLSYSKNIPSVKRFYFVLKLVNLSFITYLVTIKGIDNWFIW